MSENSFIIIKNICIKLEAMHSEKPYNLRILVPSQGRNDYFLDLKLNMNVSSKEKNDSFPVIARFQETWVWIIFLK